jgi:hypothetical protein
MTTNIAPEPTAGVLVYWLPLGAGGHLVRFNGHVYEAWTAHRQHRRPADLYHCALVVHLGGDRYVIEMAPVWSMRDGVRGVMVEGPVGVPWLGRFAAFRYEIRRWRGGRIPDIAEAVDSPARVATDIARVRYLLDLVPQAPPVTWGRDELHTGDMWNSNSLVSWLLVRSGHDLTALRPPANGRAPGWVAGVVLAARQQPLRVPVRSASSPAGAEVCPGLPEQGI